MTINLTTLAATAVTAAVNGATMFFVIRYLTKAVDHIEKNGKNSKVGTIKRRKKRSVLHIPMDSSRAAKP